MNEMSVKPANILDPQSTKTSGGTTATAVAGLASSFKDLVARVGFNLDSGLSEISGKSGITAVGDNINSRQQTDDHSTDPRDDGRDRFVERGADDRGDRDRNEPQRAERAGNDGSDEEAPRRDSHHDGQRDAQDRPRDDQQADKPAHADKPAGDDRRNGDETAKAGSDGKDANTAGSQENNAGGGQNSGNGETAGGGQQAQGLVAQAATAQGLDATALINAVGGIAHAAQGPAADAGKTQAAAALAAATTATQKQAGVHGAQINNGNHQGQGAQNQNTNTAAGPQVADPNAKGNANIQQQTAQLAQVLGQDAKVKIDVAVNQEAETLSSRPTATLTAGSALAGDSKGQAQSGPQTANHSAANAQNAAAQANAAQTQGGQGQAQNQQAGAQNGQAQAGAQANAGSGGASSGPGGVHAAGPSTAGGEQANAANTATAGAGPQQTQQSQQSQQATQLARPQQPMQSSVAEQVSVKITKALQAGQDRITIRLNPAELGRVEVKMELTHDGRATAIVTADNKDTLDLLRRDSSDLQKALEEGGMQLSDGDLSFNLRGEEGQMAEDGDGAAGDNGGEEEEIAEEFVDTEPEIIVAHEGGVLVHGRLDVRA